MFRRSFFLMMFLFSSVFLKNPLFSMENESVANVKVGVVNFNQCIERSKKGRKEQKYLEESKKEMSSILEKMQKDLEETAKKLQDPDFLDSISADEVENMKRKLQNLGQEFNRYEAQYVQMLNQAKMRFFHSISSNVGKAADLVAKERGISLVMDSDVCFFHNSSLDLTEGVLLAMDKFFDEGEEEISSLEGDDK